MAEATPSVQFAKQNGALSSASGSSPMQPADYSRTINAMMRAAAPSTHVPAVEIDENFPANEKARISAALMNDMIAHYWSPDAVPQKESLKDGTYTRDNGTYVIEDGRITSLTTAKGQRFSDIKYDPDGRVLSLRTPEGYRWEQRCFVGFDGMLKRDGYDLHLSNLKLHYDRLIIDSKGVTHLNTGRPGYVSSITVGGARGTMHIGKDGAMQSYSIVTD
jgi:hypothetical protein